MAPAKSIPMNLLMMYMSGNGVQIFSMMVVYMTVVNPLKAMTTVTMGRSPGSPSLCAVPQSETLACAPDGALFGLPAGVCGGGRVQVLELGASSDREQRLARVVPCPPPLGDVGDVSLVDHTRRPMTSSIGTAFGARWSRRRVYSSIMPRICACSADRARRHVSLGKSTDLPAKHRHKQKRPDRPVHRTPKPTARHHLDHADTRPRRHPEQQAAPCAWDVWQPLHHLGERRMLKHI